MLDVIGAPGFLDRVAHTAQHLRQGLESVAARHPAIFDEVRGDGMLLGLHCIPLQADIQAACAQAGLLTLPASENVMRLTPPLIVTPAQCDQACAMIDAACSALRA